MRDDRAIEEIKSRLDIREVVSEYVDLKRAGQNWKGLCPFHAEKSPSFMVNPARQIFHCFGCNKGGDLFTFIMEREGMSFPEALEFLAGRAGITIEKTPGAGSARGVKDSLHALNAEALGFYRAALAKSGNAMAYLEKRGLTAETIERFGLGFAAASGDALLKHLVAAGFSAEQARAAGLATQGTSGLRDFFRDRIIFPIADMQGRPIAFGGRTMSADKNIPKYLNSPESALFKKSETCYALNLAKQSIAQKGYSMVVEGYFDVIICHQFGFRNAVAPMGTALTPGHLRKLRKFTPKILLTFDGDTAGVNAAQRSLELVFAEGMIAKVVLLPEGEDPDTLLRAKGADHFKAQLGRALTPAAFFVSRMKGSKVEAVRRLLGMLSACPDGLIRDETLRELGDLVSEKVLRHELALMSSNPPKIRPQEPSAPVERVVPDAAVPKEEELLLRISLTMPSLARRVVAGISPSDFEDGRIRGIMEKIEALVSGGAPLSADILLRDCNAEERTLVSRNAIDPGIDTEHVDRNIADCILGIALRSIERRITLAGKAGDAESLRDLYAERQRLLSASGG